MESSDLLLAKWYKRNFYIRIMIIIVLIMILASVIYFRYGVPPNMQDQKLERILTDNNRVTLVDCRAALIYYYEHEIKTITDSQAKGLYDDFNATMLIAKINNISIT